MKVHHLNCACMCPAGAKMFPAVFPQKVICHCLLIEAKAGLVLVDTGFSEAALKNPKSIGLMGSLLGLQSTVEDAAIHQVQRLGFKISDIRHLIPTHLDSDHAGAVVDFPEAQVHTAEQELTAVLNPQSLFEKLRYRDFIYSHSTRWTAHSFEQGEDWFGFKGVRPIAETDDEILLIPLFGHTRGHFGVAVRSSKGWLLHVGDAYYHHAELTAKKSLAFKMFQKTLHVNYTMAMDNQRRLVDLKQRHGHEISIFCAHDPSELIEEKI